MRRLTLSINRLMDENEAERRRQPVQLDLFSDYGEIMRQRERDEEELAKERRRQETMLKIKKMFGKNAILKGLNFADGATQRVRNQQIGGHHE